MPLPETIAKAEKEISAGRAWRAKEILRSSLGNYGYDAGFYKTYGSVLLQMGDLMQAGKYLFLSTRNLSSDEREAVEIYLERHSKRNFRGLIASFSPAARLKKLSLYPEHVQEKLKELGAKDDLVGRMNRIGAKTEHIGIFLFLGFLLFLIIFCFIGFIQIIRWIL
jgi:hypothetical protein